MSTANTTHYAHFRMVLWSLTTAVFWFLVLFFDLWPHSSLVPLVDLLQMALTPVLTVLFTSTFLAYLSIYCKWLSSILWSVYSLVLTAWIVLSHAWFQWTGCIHGAGFWSFQSVFAIPWHAWSGTLAQTHIKLGLFTQGVFFVLFWSARLWDIERTFERSFPDTYPYVVQWESWLAHFWWRWCVGFFLFGLLCISCVATERMSWSIDPLTRRILTKISREQFPIQNTRMLQLSGTKRTKRWNVIFLVTPSIRPTHTGLENPELETMPFLSEWGHQAVQLRNMYPVTSNAHMSFVPLLCGLYPNLRRSSRTSSMSSIPGRCLPDILREKGYVSALFTSRAMYGARLQKQFVQMGFSEIRGHEHIIKSKFYEKLSPTFYEDKVLIQSSLRWIKKQKQPFFLTYWMRGARTPYHVPKMFPRSNLSGAYTKQQRAYARSLRYQDTFLRSLFRSFRDRGLLNNTVFIMLSPNGSLRPFSSTVPKHASMNTQLENRRSLALIRYPSLKKGRVIKRLHQHIDIVPTLVDLLGYRSQYADLPGSSVLHPAKSRTLRSICSPSQSCLYVKKDRFSMRVPLLQGTPWFMRSSSKSTSGSNVWMSQALARSIHKAYGLQALHWKMQIQHSYHLQKQRIRYAAVLRTQRWLRHKAKWTFGHHLQWLHTELHSGVPKPGHLLDVSVVLRVLQHVPRSWKLFVHLELYQKKNGKIRLHYAERKFQDGLVVHWPMHRWTQGSTIRDRIRFILPRSFPKDAELRLYLGAWSSRTGHVSYSKGGKVHSIRKVLLLSLPLKAKP